MTPTRVLLADDHTIVRAGLRNALEALPNLQIIGEVGNGRDLLESVNRLTPDLLVMDINMPDFEPVSAVQTLRASHPNLKILIVSAYDDEPYVVGLLKAGVDGYHLKDQPLSDLQLAAQRILNGERWISSPLIDRIVHRRPALNSIPLPSLTRRQRELLRYLSQGADNRRIALALELSVKTVENHLTALYRAINVENRLEALNFALRHPEVFAVTGAESAEPAQSSRSAPEITILLVDDNARYRQQLSSAVGKICPTALRYEAEDIVEALRLAERAQPQLAFIDVVLRDEDGIQCARRMRNISPLTRIVLISAYPDREFRRLALDSGAMAFLDKRDLDAAAVRQVIEDSLR
ncbi:MAG: response regulator [Anaerolineales bacterium]